MVYKPGRVTAKFEYGPSGAAKIMIHPSGTKVKVMLKTDDGTKEYVLPKDKCPDNITNGIFFAQVSKAGDKLMAVRPWDGVFEVKFQKFFAKKDQPPQAKQNKDWPDLWQFTAILEIVSGAEKGMTIPMRLNYWFAPVEEEINGEIKMALGYDYHPKSKYMPFLVDFCDATCVWNKGPMPYKDNVLPMIEKRILAEDKTFKVVVKAGYPQSIIGGSSVEDEFAPTVEE